jgi:hypothetical protein
VFIHIKGKLQDFAQFYMGKGHTVKHISDKKIIAIPFTCADGNFTIEVCLGK